MQVISTSYAGCLGICAMCLQSVNVMARCTTLLTFVGCPDSLCDGFGAGNTRGWRLDARNSQYRCALPDHLNHRLADYIDISLIVGDINLTALLLSF